MPATAPPKMLMKSRRCSRNPEDAHEILSGDGERLRAPSGVLGRLRAAGVRVAVDGDRLTAGPRALLTDELRALIRGHKAELIELLSESPDLRDYAPTSLQLGSLVVCEACHHFEARPGHRPDAWCRRHSVDTWARVPFSCHDHERAGS